MRWVREWPRLFGVVVVLAVVLVLIGVVVAAAARSGGGGSRSASSTTAARAPQDNHAALVERQARTINRLRAAVATQHDQVVALRQQLRRERELRRIHTNVKHDQKHQSNRR
jgi:predicted PurR-regulated permease PerM